MRGILSTSVAVALLAATGSSVAWADVSASESAGLEEVTVTARRKSEDAQTVPLTVTAVTAETLERQDIRTVTDLGRSVPGLAICCQRGEVQYAFIRGVPGVRGYFAEMPAVLDGNAYYFDVGNVQVLKGPQGTLFGNATNGGAILNEPRRPGTEAGGYATATLGNFNRRGFEAAVNLPGNETVQARLAFVTNNNDGYVHDLANRRAYGDDDYWAARLGVNINFSDAVENYLVANYYDANGTRPPFTPVQANAGFWGFVNPNFYNSLLAPMMAQQAKLDRYHLVGTFAGQTMKRRMLNVVDQFSWKINDDLTVRNIAGYATTEFFSRFDADGTPFSVYDNNVPPTRAPSKDRILSEELQLQGSAASDRLQYTIGTFSQRTRGGKSDGAALADLSSAFGILTGAQISSNRQSTRAFYAEGTYNLGDATSGLSLTAGYRQTRDRVGLRQSNTIWIRLPSGDVLNLAAIGAVPATDYDLDKTFKKGTYRLGLQYKLDADTMFYLTASRGYSAGGFNLSNPRGAEAFSPESLKNLELGMKSDWTAGNWRGRTNLAIYRGNYDDIQVSTTLRTCTNPADNTTCSFGVGVNNAARGRIEGAEIEFTLLPTEGFEFGGNASWMKSRYTEYRFDPDGTGPAPAEDRSGQPFVFIPKLKYSLFGAVEVAAGSLGGDLHFGVDYTWQDDLYTSATPHPAYYDQQKSFGTLNFSAAWSDSFGRKGLTTSLYCTNAANNDRADGGFGAYNSLGLWGVSVAVPRQYGLRIRYDF